MFSQIVHIKAFQDVLERLYKVHGSYNAAPLIV